MAWRFIPTSCWITAALEIRTLLHLSRTRSTTTRAFTRLDLRGRTLAGGRAIGWTSITTRFIGQGGAIGHLHREMILDLTFAIRADAATPATRILIALRDRMRAPGSRGSFARPAWMDSALTTSRVFPRRLSKTFFTMPWAMDSIISA